VRVSQKLTPIPSPGPPSQRLIDKIDQLRESTFSNMIPESVLQELTEKQALNFNTLQSTFSGLKRNKVAKTIENNLYMRQL